MLYNNCAGERMISYMESVGANIHGDLPRAELLDFDASRRRFILPEVEEEVASNEEAE